MFNTVVEKRCIDFSTTDFSNNMAATLLITPDQVRTTTTGCGNNQRSRTGGAGTNKDTINVHVEVTSTAQFGNDLQLGALGVAIQNLGVSEIASVAGVLQMDVTVPSILENGVSAFLAPSPPPPTPPPPSPPLPPMDCTLDFLRASSYWQDLEQEQVMSGSDGNLVQEFMEMERIMHEQYESITAGEPRGTNQAYTCRVANLGHMYECLDIAATTTLSNQYGETTFNESFTTTTGSLEGNLFVHDNLMLDIATLESTNASNTPLFGMTTTCGNGKIMGDGVVNGFDTYVLIAAQFGLGAYASVSRAFSEVVTVNGRNDTKDRCDSDPYNRLEWQTRVAEMSCFTASDEDAYQQQLAGRRLEERLELSQGAEGPTSELLFGPQFTVAQRSRTMSTNANPSPASQGWSPFGLYDEFNATHKTTPVVSTESYIPPIVTLRTGVQSASSTVRGLGIVIFEYAKNAQGTWYWINIPSVHAAMELTILGARNEKPIPLSNLRAPNYKTDNSPEDPNSYELRFIRHREFYNQETHKCAAIQSSRVQSNVMQNGAINVAQSMRAGVMLCAFDLILWKPASTPEYAPGCSIALGAGSVAMDFQGGGLQEKTACALSKTAISPPPAPLALPPALPPAPPAWPPESIQVVTMTQTLDFPGELKGLKDMLSRVSGSVASTITDGAITVLVTRNSTTAAGNSSFGRMLSQTDCGSEVVTATFKFNAEKQLKTAEQQQFYDAMLAGISASNTSSLTICGNPEWNFGSVIYAPPPAASGQPTFTTLAAVLSTIVAAILVLSVCVCCRCDAENPARPLVRRGAIVPLERVALLNVVPKR